MVGTLGLHWTNIMYLIECRVLLWTCSKGHARTAFFRNWAFMQYRCCITYICCIECWAYHAHKSSNCSPIEYKSLQKKNPQNQRRKVYKYKYSEESKCKSMFSLSFPLSFIPTIRRPRKKRTMTTSTKNIQYPLSSLCTGYI